MTDVSAHSPTSAAPIAPAIWRRHFTLDSAGIALLTAFLYDLLLPTNGEVLVLRADGSSVSFRPAWRHPLRVHAWLDDLLEAPADSHVVALIAIPDRDGAGMTIWHRDLHYLFVYGQRADAERVSALLRRTQQRVPALAPETPETRYWRELLRAPDDPSRISSEP